MDFYGCHFEYAGEMSRKYGLIIASVNTQRNLLLSGNTESASFFNKKNNTRHDLGKIYSDAPFEFDMEVVSEDVIDGDNRRAIQKWLFNQRGYQKLYIDRAEEVFGETFDLSVGGTQRTYLNCKFVNPEKIEDGRGVVGFKFKVECDSHLAWQDPSFEREDFPGGVDSVVSLSVVTDTDSDCYVYPKISLTTGSVGGSLIICNESDDESRITALTDIPPNTLLVINSQYNYVSSGYYANFTNRNFPRLLDGENEIVISGDVVSVKFEWQNMRYL